MENKAKPVFTMQWHLTTSCRNYCKHCYMIRNSNMLTLKNCKKIVDDFKLLLLRWDCLGRIHLTGGDPLLYPSFFELLDYIRSQMPEVKIGILGNPELLTEKILLRLKKIGIYSYQMSLDGLKNTHDKIRYRGSFEITLKKFKLLKEYGIKTVVMSTVSKLNIEEIPKLVDIIIIKEINLFGFHRFIPIGEGENVKMCSEITPLEYRDFMFKMYSKYEKYKKSKTLFGRGEPLQILLEQEMGIFQIHSEIKNKSLIWGGCSIGCSEICVLEDGSVLACRRMPDIIGKVPQQKLRDIFIKSNKLNVMRRVEEIENCQKCDLIFYCRGCRAAAYTRENNYFSPDPQCWKYIERR